MNMEIMFDLARSIRETRMEGDPTARRAFNLAPEGAPKKEIMLSLPDQEKALKRSIQAFMHAPVGGSIERPIQAFAGSADLPALTKDVFNVTMQTPNFDLLWSESFRGVSLAKGQLSWEIATVDTGITFKMIPEGGKVEYADIAGEKEIVEIQKYGAGLGVTWEIVEGRKLYRFVQIMEDARAKLYKLWADVHYGLLATAGATNQITWQGVATDRTIDRDIATINKGSADLGDAVKDSGYGDVANARFLLYVSPRLRGRMTQALNATSAQTSGSGTGPGTIVDFNVELRSSWNSAIPANKGLLVLPGNKIQNAVYLREMGLSRMEQESLNELRTYWTAFGGVVADADQVYELAFA